MQGRIIFRSCHAAAAGCEDGSGCLSEVSKNRGFDLSEAGLAVLCENLGNGAARAADYFCVRVDKRTVERVCQRLPDGALAAAGHADEHDVLHLMGQKTLNAVDFRVRNFRIRKILARLFRLRDEHRKAACVRYRERLGLQHQRCARGVVDNVQNALGCVKTGQINRAHAGSGVHAEGRCVDQNLCVPVAVQVFIIVFARAGDNDDGGRAEGLQHMADRDRCAAGAEDKRLFPSNVHAAFLKQPRKAERVGVVAGKLSCAVYDRVDASDGRSLRRYFVKQRHDGLFVGDRDVQAVKRAGL